MTPELWEAIQDKLTAALKMDSAERVAFLAQVGKDDPEAQRELESLLAAHAQATGSFLRAPGTPDDDAGPKPVLGRRLGNYQIIAELGSGGMGEVYRAIRVDDQYQKEVAIKLIRTGQSSGFVVSRFKTERQILAGLEHPNIARLLDGGTSEDGVPYFVMELIEGEPIDRYCRSHALTVPERLRLFLQVCSAVQYAHQHLIIHRDIKPSNILVTASGVPKLLDFGIAKILEPGNETGQPDPTLTVFRVLTPAYASPEQAKGDPITTASDVYSLGIVLYELLALHHPYFGHDATPQELLRAACELDPEKPSAMARRRSEATTTALAPELELENASRAKLSRRLQGDLDNIVLMSVRKEPPRRYSSVERFTEDIRRHLESIPVAARRDTVGYRASKFINRHRVGVTAGTAMILLILAALAITIREDRIAKRRFNDVRSLANSLIFDVHDSIRGLPGSTPARKIIVDRALQYLNVLAQESAGDTGLQRELAAAYEKVGSVQGDYLQDNLGDSKGALESYRKALAIRRQVDASSRDWLDRLGLAKGYRLVAHQEWATGDTRAGRADIDRALAISDVAIRAHPEDPKALYETSFDHSVSARIGYPGDPASHQKIIEDYRRALVADDAEMKIEPNNELLLYGYAIDLGNFSAVVESSNPQAALANYQKGLEINLKLTQISPDMRYRRSVAISYGSIASVYDDLGNYDLVFENNMKGLSIYQDLVQADPKNALFRQGLSISYENTATSCARVGKMPQALEYSSKSAEIMQTLVASATPTSFQRHIYAAILAGRGTILISANQPDAAIALLENSRSIYESMYKAGTGDKLSSVAACDVKLGEAFVRARKAQAADDDFRQALTIAEPLVAKDGTDLDALYVAADAYSGLGGLTAARARLKSETTSQRKADWGEARSWYQKSLDTWHRIQHPNHTAPNSFEVGDPAIVAAQLKTAETALSSLR